MYMPLKTVHPILETIGPMYAGLVTPVEGAGIGALGAVIVGRIFGKFDWQALKKALVSTAEITSIIIYLHIKS